MKVFTTPTYITFVRIYTLCDVEALLTFIYNFGDSRDSDFAVENCVRSRNEQYTEIVEHLPFPLVLISLYQRF